MSKTLVNRKHKDRLFSFIFGRSENRRWTLDLYNAINGSSYEKSDDIEITTLEDVIYMGMKNDVSFILYENMNIYEHQSTINPNMPLRELMYVGKLYDKFIFSRRLNIYGRSRIVIPVPKLVVFYNGRDYNECKVLNLYDLFQDPSQADKSDISVRVKVININYGQNEFILRACRPLSEYSWFIEEIRRNRTETNIETAIQFAMEAMPKEFEIREFLIHHRAEVMDMCLTEYNEAETMELFREEFIEEGIKQGVIRTLFRLVSDGILSMSDAAKRADMSEEVFVEQVKSLKLLNE